jgi:alpha-L-rhamnosidase
MANGMEAGWQAQWIWGYDAANKREENAPRYFYFRRTFGVAGDVQAAVMRVCADSRYRLWLNGQLVGHGPARSDPAYQYYDVYDLTAQLRTGPNTLAVLATHYGIGTCFSRLGSPGFLLQADITFANGETLAIGTNAEWKCAPAPYQTGFPRMSIQLAYPEVFDARAEPASWNFPGYDDRAWGSAVPLGPVGTPPWTTLVPRDIPLPYFRAVAPVRVLQVNTVEKRKAEEAQDTRHKIQDTREEGTGKEEDAIQNPKSKIQNAQLLTPAEDMERATRLQPAPNGSVTHKHPALFTVAPQTGAEGVSVVLDFGKEVSGFPLLVVRRGGGGRVDIGYSERIEADGSVNPHHLTNDVRYADRLLLRPGHQNYEPLDHRAFRYMRLDFYDCPEPVEMLVEMRLSGYPVQHRGDFQCSDALLQRIWEVGRYTTELCMDDGFMDCPWRERGQWLGDARVEGLVAAYAFGDTALARKALLQYPQSQEESGWFRGVFPSDPPFDPILPTFCMIWPVALWDYFVLSGDRSLLEAVWPNLERLVAALKHHISDDGLLAGLPGWVFVDWANVNTKGQSTAVNAMAYDALQHAAKIARAIGYPEKGGDWQIMAGDIREAVNDLLWDRERAVYVDGIAEGEIAGETEGERLTTVSEQAIVLCALVGIADREQTARILDILINGEAMDVRIATPYFSFYLLSLLYREKRFDAALDYMRSRWRTQLDAGATTFWEQWEGHWSLCHAWSAAPTHDLMAYVAGIRPTQPGWEEFDAHLEPCGLSWLRCTVPTPRGDIALAYHYRTDTAHIDPTGHRIPLGATSPVITVNLMVPTGTRAHVRIPLHGLKRPSVTLNGKPIWEEGVPISPGGDKFLCDGDAVAFAIIGGRYHIEIERGGVDAKLEE